MADTTQMQYDALTRQLERMRAMQYAYNRKFFTLLLVAVAGTVWALVYGGAVAWGILPFGLVTAGFTASFFLHSCDFARVHARALEERLNVLMGSRVLIASELEAEYFYPHASRKFSGIPLEGRWTLFHWFTLHHCLVWCGAMVAAGVRLQAVLTGGWMVALVLGWLAWGTWTMQVLYGWFAEAEAEKRMRRQLAEAYGLDVDSR